MLNRLCSAHFSSRVLSCEKKKMDCLSVDFSSSEAHSMPPVAPSTPFSIIFPWHTHRPPATPTGRAFIFRFPTVSVSANPSLSNSVHSLNPSAASGGLRWGAALSTAPTTSFISWLPGHGGVDKLSCSRNVAVSLGAQDAAPNWQRRSKFRPPRLAAIIPY